MQDLRPTWNEYFLILAKLAATRSTCRAFPVGAVIVQDRKVLATGYNGPPSGTPHCIEQGFCYPGLESCDASNSLPSRAIHAEANAIAQAAKHGISTHNSSIYVTLEPCLSCLKLIIASGITKIFYETASNKNNNNVVSDFLESEVVLMQKISLSSNTQLKAIEFISNPISLADREPT